MSLTESLFNIRCEEPMLNKPSDKLVSDRMVGIEIELNKGRYVESAGLSKLYWQGKIDNSLHNGGREFVFKKPLWGEDIVKAVYNFEESVKKLSKGRRPIIDLDTSLHAHIDARNLEIKEVSNLCRLYTLVERALFHYADPNRYTNIFSLAYGADCTAINQIATILANSSKSVLADTIYNFPKYSALNLNPLSTLGSVEFRLRSATWKAQEILDWTNILLELVESAKKVDASNQELLEQSSISGPEFILETIFPTTYTLLLPYLSPEDMLYGVRVLQDLDMAMEALSGKEFINKYKYKYKKPIPKEEPMIDKAEGIQLDEFIGLLAEGPIEGENN